MEDTKSLEVLKDFVMDSVELERLEDLLSSFNLFETLGIVETEIRHSNVLAWLLQPDDTHGLGDHFLKKLLKRVAADVMANDSGHHLVFLIESMELERAYVLREWEHTDIVVVIPEDEGGIAVLIENKVKSEEHGDQLNRYRESLVEHFENFTHFLVYLTPNGDTPSDNMWQIMDYSTIRELVSASLKARRGSVGQDTALFLEHYLVVLGRYIVGNSEIEAICKSIYKKHKTALDIIYQYRPDVVMEISSLLQSRIDSLPTLILDKSSKSAVRFTTNRMNSLLPCSGQNWTPSNRMVLFELMNRQGSLLLKLFIGPGRQEDREKLFRLFEKDKKLFKLVDRKHGTQWHAVWQKKILSQKDYDTLETEVLLDKVEKKFDLVLNNEIQKIENFITSNLRHDDFL